VAAHADSLLRTARRHSICLDDAQDAYQHAIEIFLREAHRLDPGRAAGWLHVVVKREAQALRGARQELLTSTPIDLDGREAPDQPTPEERLLRFDMVSRSAEALKRLKPHELRALWLRAQGHSYSEIGAMTGWSYTKINRCLTEGRRSFLERYERIESGEECQHWLPVISAMVDGEATAQQVAELRPHLRNCPGCRATLKALQDSSTPLAALMPLPLLVVGSGAGEQVSSLLVRIYEGIAGGFPERAVHHVTKAQALLEASAAGKLTAVAASAAAVAGGGYASVERVIERPAAARSVAQTHVRHHRAPPAKAALSVTPSVAAKTVILAPPPPAETPDATRAGERPTPAPPAARAQEFRATGSESSSRSTSTGYVTRAASYRTTTAKSPASTNQGFAPKGQEADFAP
jgi:DNA-directed RNA polymerase specialized sigma24 family protein/anti-sigma factor RsiW